MRHKQRALPKPNLAPTTPSRWKTNLPYARCRSPVLRSWLLGRDSLTHKLVQLSKKRFRVEVLTQHKGRASRDEARALNIPYDQLCLLREVVLWGANQPWVFARSVLPLSSLTGSLRHLRKQGAKPLGAYLFQQSNLTRSKIETAQFTTNDSYVPKHLMTKESVWGRRSIFYLDKRPLLVSEVFLHAFPIR